MLGSGLVGLNPALGRFGGWGLFCCRDLMAGALWRPLWLGGGSAVGRGFGGSHPQVGSSPEPCAPGAGISHSGDGWGYRGPPRDAIPHWWLGLVAKCSPVPRLALGRGFSLMVPGRTRAWRAVPSRAAGPSRAAWLLARGQAQNKPGCQGRQGAGAENIPSLTLAFAYRSRLAHSGEWGHGPAA